MNTTNYVYVSQSLYYTIIDELAYGVNIQFPILQYCWLIVCSQIFYFFFVSIHDIDGLIQNFSIPIPNALEMLQYCTKPSIILLIIF